MGRWLEAQLPSLFDNYKARTEGAQTEGGAMFSKYGRTNRQEYVAEAYRLYYGSSEEKAQLASADPGMFNYLKSQGLEKQS